MFTKPPITPHCKPGETDASPRPTNEPGGDIQCPVCHGFVPTWALCQLPEFPYAAQVWLIQEYGCGFQLRMFVWVDEFAPTQDAINAALTNVGWAPTTNDPQPPAEAQAFADAQWHEWEHDCCTCC